MNIKVINDNDIKQDIIRNILNDLPEWFGNDVSNEEYINNSINNYVIVVEDKANIVGFISLRVLKNSIDIDCIGVSREYHHRGIGSMLVNESIIYAKTSTKDYLTVKTLAASHPDLNYQKTRNFYYKMGFKDLEVIDSIWGKATPCLIMIMNIENKR